MPEEKRIKRWAPWQVDCPRDEDMVVADDGPFVLYEDHLEALGEARDRAAKVAGETAASLMREARYEASEALRVLHEMEDKHVADANRRAEATEETLQGLREGIEAEIQRDCSIYEQWKGGSLDISAEVARNHRTRASRLTALLDTHSESGQGER